MALLSDAEKSPPKSMILLLATSGGMAIASIYYAQPMLPLLSNGVHASTRVAGFIPTLTQIGYALGILFLAPLGDRYNRRLIILIKAGVLCLALLRAFVDFASEHMFRDDGMATQPSKTEFRP